MFPLKISKTIILENMFRMTMEVGPTCHYVMGGVRVDAETGASTVTGLFAAGECAGGMHGANRLGGNSLSDLLVFTTKPSRDVGQRVDHRLANTADGNPKVLLLAKRGDPFAGRDRVLFDLKTDLLPLVDEPGADHLVRLIDGTV